MDELTGICSLQSGDATPSIVGSKDFLGVLKDVVEDIVLLLRLRCQDKGLVEPSSGVSAARQFTQNLKPES